MNYCTKQKMGDVTAWNAPIKDEDTTTIAPLIFSTSPVSQESFPPANYSIAAIITNIIALLPPRGHCHSPVRLDKLTELLEEALFLLRFFEAVSRKNIHKAAKYFLT